MEYPKSITRRPMLRVACLVGLTFATIFVSYGVGQSGSARQPDRSSHQLGGGLRGPAVEESLSFTDARLMWGPSVDPNVGRELDLCIDTEAILAGLDGGDLEGERLRVGVDCTASDTSGTRYMIIDAAGEPHTRQEVAEEGLATSMEQLGALRMLGVLGHSDVEPPAGPGRLVVLEDSVRVSGTHIRGLLSNNSEDYLAGVTISALSDSGENLGRYEIPFIMQSSEVAPFEIAIPKGSDEAGITFKIEGVPDFQAPLERSLLFLDAPGYWEGEAESFPGVPIFRSELPEHGDVRFYQSTLKVALPLGVPEAEQVLSSTGIATPLAQAAFVDAAGRVVDVVDVPIFSEESGNSEPAGVLKTGQGGVVGVALPDGAVDVMFWAFGKESK